MKSIYRKHYFNHFTNHRITSHKITTKIIWNRTLVVSSKQYLLPTKYHLRYPTSQCSMNTVHFPWVIKSSCVDNSTLRSLLQRCWFVAFITIFFTTRSSKSLFQAPWINNPNICLFSCQYLYITSFPGIGNLHANSSTSFLSPTILSLKGSFFRASWNFLKSVPETFWISRPSLIPWSMKSATFSKSGVLNWRDVRAGAPMRRPPGWRALLSPGQVFLLTWKKKMHMNN